MVYGSVCFGLVSVLAFSIWAFKLVPGAGPMFAAIALTFIVLSGLTLSRLISTSVSRLRFSIIFASAFFAYAFFWCVFWFGLKGKYHADLFGSVVGLATLTWILQRALGTGKPSGFLSRFAVVFMFYTLGYYFGGECYYLVGGSTGRLLWGASYGLGFGAGLGYLLYHCQTRQRLPRGLR